MSRLMAKSRQKADMKYVVSPFSGLLTAILAWHLNKGIIIIIDDVC